MIQFRDYYLVHCTGWLHDDSKALNFHVIFYSQSGFQFLIGPQTVL